MKQILKPTEYNFFSSAQEVTFDYPIALQKILLIVNLTRGVIIYNPANVATKGILNEQTLQLDFDTTFQADTDDLQIFIDNESTPAQNDVSDAMLFMLAAILEKMPMTDQLDRLLCNVQGSTAITINNGSRVSIGEIVQGTSGTQAIPGLLPVYNQMHGGNLYQGIIVS